MAENSTVPEENEGANPPSIFADLAKLRLSTSMAGANGTEILWKVRVRKPSKQEFIRVNPAEDMMLPTLIYVDQHERETLMVSPHMRDSITEQLKPAVLVVAINRQNEHFVWPVMIPAEDRSRNDWHETARHGCELAKTQWTRISADMSSGLYRLFRAEGDLSEPEWCGRPLAELLELAFRDRVIDREDHPAIKRLRGLV